VAGTWRRIASAARESLSLEGLVAALVGGGVWAIAAGVLSQVTSVRIGPAIAVGAGFGLLAAAAFIWLVVRPDRRRRQERTNVLKTSARQQLSELAEQGRRLPHPLPPISSGKASQWRRDVESFLLVAFGRETAEKAMLWDLDATRELAEELDDMRRNLDDLQLRPGYRGWGPGRR
jgi:hypothetical protein